MTPLRFACACAHRGLHFRRDLRRIRRAGAKHDLKSRIHHFNRAHEMDDPLLPRDPPDEKQKWLRRIDPESRHGASLDRSVDIR